MGVLVRQDSAQISSYFIIFVENEYKFSFLKKIDANIWGFINVFVLLLYVYSFGLKWAELLCALLWLQINWAAVLNRYVFYVKLLYILVGFSITDVHFWHTLTNYCHCNIFIVNHWYIKYWRWSFLRLYVRTKHPPLSNAFCDSFHEFFLSLVKWWCSVMFASERRVMG